MGAGEQQRAAERQEHKRTRGSQKNWAQVGAGDQQRAAERQEHKRTRGSQKNWAQVGAGEQRAVVEGMGTQLSHGQQRHRASATERRQTVKRGCGQRVLGLERRQRQMSRVALRVSSVS